MTHAHTQCINTSFVNSFGGAGTNEEPIDDEIYDLPPEGESQVFQPPPPPMGPPPDQEPIDDEIYDCPPGTTSYCYCHVTLCHL